MDEILRRRIGRNELSTIQVAQAYVQAQNEYAALDPAGLGHGVYAQRIVSHPGKKDGLYWPTPAGETPSPLGDLAAQASAEGYKAGAKPIPYHGYYYRILTRQGAGAPGGAYDYLVKGKMKGGFALIAVPAEYGNSGIMTFMVNHDGTRVSEGSRAEDNEGRSQDRRLRAGPDLDEGGQFAVIFETGRGADDAATVDDRVGCV